MIEGVTVLRTVFIKKLFFISTLLISLHLFSQDQTGRIVDINLGLYVCNNKLSSESTGNNFAFACNYRTDKTNNDIEIISVVINKDIFIKDKKEECINRISAVKDIYNAIEGIPISQLGRDHLNEENYLWGAAASYNEGYLAGFLDQTYIFNSASWNEQISYLKTNLLFHVNIIDRGMFDDDEETKFITMCYWKYGEGVDNPYIREE